MTRIYWLAAMIAEQHCAASCSTRSRLPFTPCTAAIVYSQLHSVTVVRTGAAPAHP